MNSLENIRISAWLTIPKTIGRKFPVVVAYPGYQVKLPPLFFSDFICLSLNTRATDPDNQADVNPEKKDMLTLHMDDPNKYIYRGIIMDCVRSIDFLFANEYMGFDLNRICVFGGSQGGYLCLATSALLPKKITACIADVPILCDLHTNIAMEAQIREETFVLKYINRYLVANSGLISKENILQTACYYEGQNFISKVRCPVLMGIGLLDPLAPASTSIAAYNKLSSAVKKESEIHVFPDLTHEVKDWHNVFKSMWFYEKLEEGTKKR
jgi:cephalosporin-C deacetylase-like acetyl esterase